MKLKFLLLFLKIFVMIGMAIGQNQGYAKSSDGSLIFYRTFGKGTPLLIINGGPGLNSDGFENLAKDLGQFYHTIIYDQRGNGKSVLSKYDSTTINMQLMLEDIEAIRKHLQINNWNVLGHSFGGIVANLYATKHQKKILKMISSASGGIDLEILNYFEAARNSKLSKEALDKVAKIDAKINAGDNSQSTLLSKYELLAPAYVLDNKSVPILAKRLTEINTEVSNLVWADLVKINYNCAKQLKHFKKPVLIIQGKDDIINIESANKAHAVLKHSKIVLMDHCRHYGWIDNREVFFKEVRDFLK